MKAQDSESDVVLQPSLMAIAGRFALGVMGVGSLFMLAGAVKFAALSNSEEDSVLFHRKYLFKNSEPINPGPTVPGPDDFDFDVGLGPTIMSTSFEGDDIEIFGVKNANGTANRITQIIVSNADRFVRTDLDKNGRIGSVFNSEDGFSMDIDWTSNTTANIVVVFEGVEYTIPSIDTEDYDGLDQLSISPTSGQSDVVARTADFTLDLHPEGHDLSTSSSEIELEMLESRSDYSTPQYKSIRLNLFQCGNRYNGGGFPRICYRLYGDMGLRKGCVWGPSLFPGAYNFFVRVDVDVDVTVMEEACKFAVQVVDNACEITTGGLLKSGTARNVLCGIIGVKLTPLAGVACRIALTVGAKACKSRDAAILNADLFCEQMEPRMSFTAYRWDLDFYLYRPGKFATTLGKVVNGYPPPVNAISIASFTLPCDVP